MLLIHFILWVLFPDEVEYAGAHNGILIRATHKEIEQWRSFYV